MIGRVGDGRWTTGRRGDALLAVAAVAVSLLISAAQGFLKLAQPGTDNDSVMRLVQVRDLIAGQGWLDLHQYRMGLDGGFLMHWSRLVDAPIAAIMVLLRPFVGPARAELAAQFAWPALLMGLSIWLLLRAARHFGGEAARFPALVLGAAALHFLYIFEPGSLDHHNLQLALVLAMAAGLLSGGVVPGLAAGVAAAASIAIGMETMPYVAAAGAVAALLFWLRGEDELPATAGFGFGMALGASVLLLFTVRPSQWSEAACDAYSGGQAGSAILAGLGLAALAHIFGQSARVRRLGALLVLGIVSIGYVLLVYPQCLAEPYGALPPALRRFWLDRVSEAQSLASLAVNDPGSAALYYVTPLIALALMVARVARNRAGRGEILLLPLLAAAFVVSVWQVRGAIFSTALAVLPLAAWVGTVRAEHMGRPSNAGSLRLIGAWLVSFNVVWALAVGQAAALVQAKPQSSASNECEAAADFASLAALPPGTVLAISNVGAAILAFTDHRALSGPYHRNIAGNEAALNAMIGTPEAALDVVRHAKADYVAVCPGNPETEMLAERAPHGLLARLLAGETPAWLAPVGQTSDSNMIVYRVAR